MKEACKKKRPHIAFKRLYATVNRVKSIWADLL